VLESLLHRIRRQPQPNANTVLLRRNEGAVPLEALSAKQMDERRAVAHEAEVAQGRRDDEGRIVIVIGTLPVEPLLVT
jgi:hypothetical protein